jgi:hypothetical protein
MLKLIQLYPVSELIGLHVGITDNITLKLSRWDGLLSYYIRTKFDVYPSLGQALMRRKRRINTSDMNRNRKRTKTLH